MDFESEHYFRASLERMSQAHEIYRTRDNYALTMYVAGVAVECMLRAFMVIRKAEFKSHHDLPALFVESGMISVADESLRAKGLSEEEIDQHTNELRSSVNDVYNLWKNDFRYASESRLLAYLKRKRLFGKTKGNLLKAKTIELLSAAQRFINRGMVQWR